MTHKLICRTAQLKPAFAFTLHGWSELSACTRAQSQLLVFWHILAVQNLVATVRCMAHLRGGLRSDRGHARGVSIRIQEEV